MIALIALGAAGAAPASGATPKWSVHQLPPRVVERGGTDPIPLYSVSCIGESFCAAVAPFDTIAVSQTPTGGASAWRELASPTARDLEAIDCVPGLCAAGDGGGNVLTTADPTTAPFAAVNAGGSVQVTGVSCPTAAAGAPAIRRCATGSAPGTTSSPSARSGGRGCAARRRACSSG